MKEEERLRATDHEEVHMMCEPEQGVYLEEEKEDADIYFSVKLLDMEMCSYQYEMEEEDVEVRSTKDLKDYFEEIVQHKKMEEKASVEDEVPYVF